MKTYIRKGWGFDIGANFARATADLPVELAEKEYAGSPRFVIGYITADPASPLGFLRYGDSKGKVRVRIDRAAVGELQGVSR